MLLRRWGVFKKEVEGDGEEERLTPPDQDVFTPATSPGQDWIAVATPDEDGFRCDVFSGFRIKSLLVVCGSFSCRADLCCSGLAAWGAWGTAKYL